MPERLTVSEASTITELERVSEEWESLRVATASATPFQSPAWLLPWWRYLGQGELFALLVRAGGRLVGLAPLYLHLDPCTGARTLRFIGAGATDYLGAVFDPSFERPAATAVLSYLGEERHRWDWSDLAQLPASSPLLDSVAPASLLDRREPSEPCVVLPLENGAPGSTPLRGRMAAKLGYYRRRAARAGAAFDLIEDDWTPVSDRLIELHASRWTARGEPGVLAEGPVQRAHRATIPALARLEALRMHGLRVGDRLVGLLYALVDPPRPHRKTYYYLSGFDPSVATQSPGTLLIGQAIDRAVADGCAAFDFLRGNEPYKAAWGAAPVPTYRRKLRPRA